MRIGILGAGNIGGNLARLLAGSGHDVIVSFSRNQAALDKLAGEVGARSGSPADAARHGDVVVLAVPWGVVDEALERAGGPAALAGKVVIDTTNNFGRVDGVMYYATDTDDVSPVAEQIITDAGFDPVCTGTLARNDVGHQEPKGDLYGEEFHLDDALAAVAKLRGTPPSGYGRP